MDLSQMEYNKLQVFRAVYLPKSGQEPKEYLFQLTVASIIYNNRQTRVLTFKDVSFINEVAKLSAHNKLMNTLSSQVSHEMLTPLKCIIQVTDLVKQGLNNTSLDHYNLGVVSNTAKIVLSQIKGNLDNSLMTVNQFKPNLENLSLAADVVKPAIDIFIAQAKS